MQDKIQDMLNQKCNDVWCIPRDATISEAAHRMQEHDIGTLIVVGRHHTVGMVTEHDIVFGVLARDGDPNLVRVSAVMTTVPIVSRETTIEDAAALAAAADVHQIVVVDGKRVVGVIAAKELAVWVNFSRAFEISDLVGYITGCGAPPLNAVGPRSDDAPMLEASCAYCGDADDKATWELGVALCGSCASPEPIHWSPYC
jgi:Mg/Co/Ni transporter MgtE